MPDFCLPDLGEGLTEAEIVAWHVEVGDHVEVDQAVVEVETAKATVEVPCPHAGVVSARHGAVGDVVAVGSALVTVGAAIDATPVTSTPERSVAAESSGNVLIGYGTPASPARRDRRARRPVPQSHLRSPALEEARDARAVAVSSPLVRRLARESQVDVRTLTGTGPDGVVMRRDVMAAIDAGTPTTEAGSGATARPEPPSASDAPRTTRIALTGVRRATADKLSRSRREIPEATVWVDVDATALLAARAALNETTGAARNSDDPEIPIGITALLARFAVLGLKRFPELNARMEGDELVMFADVNLGFAAQTDRGLVVPVIHRADALSTAELSRELASRARTARAGRLAPRELSGGTFTLNNYGVFGVDGSAAIINHPEVAILGIGRIIERPWVVEGRIEVRHVSQLTLAFDHRACDGATAGGFLRFVADLVEKPITALRET